MLSPDPSVKAVFINVFGGILRVDRIAEGLIAAVKAGVLSRCASLPASTLLLRAGRYTQTTPSGSPRACGLVSGVRRGRRSVHIANPG